MIGKLRRLSVALLLVIAPLTSFIVPGVAHAAVGGTFTWSGAGADGNWSTAGNWVGGTAPVSGDVGDTIIINNAATFTNGSTDNLATLSLASLQFENNGGLAQTVTLANPLTITGSITQAASTTTTEDIIRNNGTAQTITLGGDVAVTSSDGGLTIGFNTADNIALASHTLTFTNPSATADVIIQDNITGSGSVVYNGDQFSLDGTNTYSGTTTITAGAVANNTSGNNAFGTSSISIASSGGLTFGYSSTTTISNPITIAGTTNGSPTTSLTFSTLTSGVTINAPAITLNGDTRFDNNGILSGLTVNLAGITTNGFCIEYLGDNPDYSNPAANGFTNAPTGCIVPASTSSTTAAPGAPNTGLALMAAHPLASLAATTTAALTILVIARRLRPVKS
ncbi:MAG TPA: hypothetical protein VMU97_01820 [Candidatus Dormibacteraeota bacterium]|nr:hypothetical protein [Candidatus Dormibacteraeota bacterium]